MSGRVVHFEIPFDDPERAAAFYAEVFGWRTNPMPSMDYVLVETGPSDQGPPSEPGFINGGMTPREGPLTTPVLVIDVDDIEASLAEIERRGGATVSTRKPVGDLGFAAYCTDSEGNVIGLWENA